MVDVGLVGLGGMGNKHFGCYENLNTARITALADAQEERLQPGESSLEINVGEGSIVVDPEKHETYTDVEKCFREADVDMVDICLPTFLHPEFCCKALEQDLHVLCEKPMALTADECQKMVEAAEDSDGMLMVAQCIRFWPEYRYLKETLESGRLGELRNLRLWRGGAAPDWAWDNWLSDHERSGGAILDLHVHDLDFAQYLLGQPEALCSTGTPRFTGGYDAVNTTLVYDKKGEMTVDVGAEMGLPAEFGFKMQFMASFDDGCLVFDTSNTPPLIEMTDSGTEHPDVKDADGWLEEIAYFVDCVENGKEPAECPPDSTAFSVRMVEAERQSIESGELVEL